MESTYSNTRTSQLFRELLHQYVDISQLLGSQFSRLTATKRDQGISTAQDNLCEALANAGRFSVIGTLGQGSFGRVIHMYDEHLGRDVAVKLLQHVDNLTLLGHFVDEGRHLAQIQHKNVATVYQADHCDGEPYIVMEYINGQRLDHYAREHALSMKEKIGLVLALASGVAAAHQKNIVHRDLKPSNILINHAGVVKVIDFGLAVKDNQRQDAGAGTPHYSAPEQWNGKGFSPASDVYSIGVIFWQLLSRDNPKGQDYLAEVNKLVGDFRGRDVKAILRRCLAKNASDRYPSAIELTQDLQKLLDMKPIQARRTFPPERAWLLCRRRPIQATLVLTLLAAMTLGSWMFHLATAYGNRLLDKTITYRIDQTLNERWGNFPTRREYEQTFLIPPGMKLAKEDSISPQSLWHEEHADDCHYLSFSFVRDSSQQIIGVRVTFTLQSGAWYDRTRGKLRGNVVLPCQLETPWYVVMLGKLDY